VRHRTHDHDRAEKLTQQVFADAAASLRDNRSPPAAKMRFVRALEALRAELDQEGVTP